MKTYYGSVKMDEKGKKKKFSDSGNLKNFTDSGNLKTSQVAGSNPVLGRLPKMPSMIIGYRMAPVSPVRDYGCRPYRRCQTSFIPKEAIEKKNGREFEPQEPTSPKVSCIGQVKKKKKQALEDNKRRRRSQDRICLPSQWKPLLPPRGVKFSKLKSFFSSKKLNQTAFCESPEIDLNNFPSLEQIKRFSSGRQCDELRNLWRDSQKLTKTCCSETNDANNSSSPLMFYSGPLVIERPKAEINLWKRRSVAPPMALNLSSSSSSFVLQTTIPSTT